MGGDMTGEEFARLLSDFTLSAETGDGARFASHFTEDPSITTTSTARIEAAPTSRI
jgi:hypothetical protein